MKEFMKNNKILKLENDEILVHIDTEFGGKIIELINKNTKHNWVWFESKQREQFKPLEYSDYDSQWIGGYEELFPNDKIQKLDGSLAPDHGELWSSSWNIINFKKEYLHLQARGYFSSSYINKTFKLQKNKVKVTYSIENIRLQKYLFKLHLAMPINNSTLKFNFNKFEKVDKNFGNIIQGNNINPFLKNLRENQNSNDFAYFYGNGGLVEVIEENNIFKLSYDNITLPYLWIFQTRGGWNNLNVNVLEPCNAGLKDIDDAYQNNLIYIPNEDKFTTWYEVEVNEI